MSFRKREKGFATKAIHAGHDPNQWDSMAVIPPLIMSTNFKYNSPNEKKKYLYSRTGNPTRDTLEQLIAALEDAKYGLVFSSGQSATSSVVSLLKTGDHCLAGYDLFGGTSHQFRLLAQQNGFEVDFIDATDVNAISNAIKPNTKLLWIETPTNPLLNVCDIEAISKLIRSKNQEILFAIDNTFLSPYFQRPLELGADISMSSCTKFMNGHTDVTMGSVAVNDDELYKRLKRHQNLMGVIPSPFDCSQMIRSIKTLPVRMDRHFSNSMTVAQFLEKHPMIERVNHPALPTHPKYEITLRQTYGHSGIMSFYLKGGYEETERFCKQLKVITLAGSLGGTESLICVPTFMTHTSVPPEQKKLVGITDNLVRLSVGLEDIDDIIEDLDRALNNCKP